MYEVKQIIGQYFDHEVKSFNLILTEDKTQISLLVVEDFEKSRQKILKDLIEEELNSYEIVSFKVEPSYL